MRVTLRWPGLIPLGLLLGTWAVVSWWFPPAFLPGPLELASRIVRVFSDRSAYAAAGATLARIAAGVVVSMLLGGALGIAMGSRRIVEAVLSSWLVVLFTVPAIAWAFVAVLWLGITDAVPIMTIVLIVCPFVATNLWEGTRALDKSLVDMAKAFKAGRRLITARVIIPHLMPYVLASLRIAFALAWKIVLIAEVFGVTRGVGRQLAFWFQAIRVDMMLAWGTSFMLTMVAIEVVAFRWWERRAFAWRHRPVA